MKTGRVCRMGAWVLAWSMIFVLCSCVSTPTGRKFDPWEGAKRTDLWIDDWLKKTGNAG